MWIWFIFASISRQIHNKILRALPRFARPCIIFWLQSPVKFIFASISGQIQRKMLRALPPFARQCAIFWLQSPAKFTTKFRELCLASLGHVLYFGFNLLSNSFSLQSPVKFKAKCWELCLASLGNVLYFGFNLRLNSQQNFESSASLRSAMLIILASNSIPGKYILASFSGQIQSGTSRASYSLRSAMRFKLATSPLTPVKFVMSKGKKIETFCVTSVGCLNFVSKCFVILKKNFLAINYNHIILYLEVYI